MKLLLCAAIVALCAAIGRLLTNRIRERLTFFRSYQSAIVRLTDHVVGANMPVGEALRSCGSGVMAQCADELQSTPFARLETIWRTCFAAAVKQKGSLNKQDAEMVAAGGTAIESLCGNPTAQQAGGYIKRLEKYVGALETEKQRKGKLLSTSGVLAGLLIALLVI